LSMLNPNQALYTKYESDSLARGELVLHIAQNFCKLHGAHVLDIGCGTGGISQTAAKQGALVFAIDIQRKNICSLSQKTQARKYPLQSVIAAGENVPIRKQQFDLIILCDVLEHVQNPFSVLSQVKQLLKKNGILYISTPNRLSLFNVLCDPHYSLPVVALLNKNWTKKVVVNLLHWQNRNKTDFAELLSFKSLTSLLSSTGFQWHLQNSQAFNYAIAYPSSLWNRPSHLNLVRLAKKMELVKYAAKIINNRPGLFNKWINPVWFVIARHKETSCSLCA
jgi:ubiquinone biosynthesis O-methyltransferase